MVTSPMTSRDPMTSQSLRNNIQNAYSSTVLVGIRPSLNIIIYCIVGTKDQHVGGYLGGAVGGTPPPEIFWTKNAMFHIFHQNSNS